VAGIERVRQKLIGIIQLFRPELPIAAGVCVMLGEIIALGHFPTLQPLLLGFACGFFLSGSALVLNDYFDLEVDRINAPQRPLPSGRVSPPEAVVLSILAGLFGLVAAALINWPALFFSIPFWGIGILYNWKYKQAGLVGNLMVSSSVAITFILGGIAVGEPWHPIVWTFSLVAFLIDLAEEIAGDAMDMEGDQTRGSKSIAITIGKKFALRISGIIFVIVTLISLVPFLLGWFGAGYLIAVSVLGIVVLYFTTMLLKSQTPKEGRLFMRRIYLTATFGMLVFIVGQFFAS
jgi:geranylgeranylglycerol-phosphate geranylgeranyltransferase